MILNGLKCFPIRGRLLKLTKNSCLAFAPANSNKDNNIVAPSSTHYLNEKQQKIDENEKLLHYIQIEISKMSRRYDANNAIPPRKIPRFTNSSSAMFQNHYNDFNEPNFYMNLTPPPPPPMLMNCGELREHHHGSLVEMDGKVNRSRLGRFIELKDQYGVTQLVAPIDNISVSKRFANMPLNSFITVVGMVKRRPDNLKNFSISTGGIEVHVDDIIRVQKIFRRDNSSEEFGGKRNYSTSATAASHNDQASNGKLVTALTSSECKHVNNDEHLIQWFIKRKNTCGSLRITDAGKNVYLVGWIEKKAPKFVHLTDGYGNTQILIENEAVKTTLNSVKESDLLLVHGRVLARPQTHITHNSSTGEIELYADKITILDANTTYEEIAGADDEEEEQQTQRNHQQQQNPEKMLEETKGTSMVNGNEFTYRSHNCGELNEKDVGREVTLCGWLEFSRMNRFFTLRDGYGQTQILVPDDLIKKVNVEALKFETILKVKGVVSLRPPKMQNMKMQTGAIEVQLTSCDVLNAVIGQLPMTVRTFHRANEPFRMKHRYIDLRFSDMQRNLRMRSNVLMKMREYLINSLGFVEVETPTLFRRTPGGAQEFVVPTQNPGQFYSLVQSPQQFKQMLMAGAIDRYFQIARCYRDESTTVNRQPEFTQLDIELSFTQPEYIMELIENVLIHSWPATLNAIEKPFPRMTFDDAMDNYGSDKPDARSDKLLLQNVSDTVGSNEAISKNYQNFAAYAITLQDQLAASCSNTLDATLNLHESKNVKIMLSKINENVNYWSENVFTIVDKTAAIALADNLNLQTDDTIIVAYGNKLDVQNAMGKIRSELIDYYAKKELLPKICDDTFKFLWVVDFPLFKPNEETQQFETTHHPFTAPHPDDLTYLDSPDDYAKCRSLAYDLVLNGQEIGGGSIRIHDANLQQKILSDILKLDSSHLSHLISALESGCPPHGGIALGLDRLLSIMCQTKSIRDVIAFPKSFEGKDLLSKAPCEISKEELQLYHLEIKK